MRIKCVALSGDLTVMLTLFEDNYVLVLKSTSLYAYEDAKDYHATKGASMSEVCIQDMPAAGLANLVYSTPHGIYFAEKIALDSLEKAKAADAIYNGAIEHIRCEEKADDVFYIERCEDGYLLGRFTIFGKKKTFETKLTGLIGAFVRHKNYAVVVINQSPRKNVAEKASFENDVIYIFDMKNEYTTFKYSKANVTVHAVAMVDSYLYTVLPGSKPDSRKLFRIKDSSDQDKLDKFLKRTFFDLAYRFAENQGYADLKPRICKAAGDHYYEKKNYTAAVANYVQTIDALDSNKNTLGDFEPSNVIKKFLDMSHLPYLIRYLEALHNNPRNLFNIHHTSLLVYSFLKQKDLLGLRKWFTNMRNKSQKMVEVTINACLWA